MENFQDTERKILSSGITLNFAPNKYLFREGQELNHIFYLVSGEAELSSPTYKITLNSSNQIFIGLTDLLDNHLHSHNLVVVSPAQFIVFEKEYFKSLLTEFPEALKYLKFKNQGFQ